MFYIHSDIFFDKEYEIFPNMIPKRRACCTNALISRNKDLTNICNCPYKKEFVIVHIKKSLFDGDWNNKA